MGSQKALAHRDAAVDQWGAQLLEGTAIERKDGGSDGGCSKADPPAEEEGKRNRGPCDSPPTERSPKKRKAGEGEDVGVKGPEGEGQTLAVDPKRPKSV